MAAYTCGRGDMDKCKHSTSSVTSKELTSSSVSTRRISHSAGSIIVVRLRLGWRLAPRLLQGPSAFTPALERVHYNDCSRGTDSRPLYSLPSCAARPETSYVRYLLSPVPTALFLPKANYHDCSFPPPRHSAPEMSSVSLLPLGPSSTQRFARLISSAGSAVPLAPSTSAPPLRLLLSFTCPYQLPAPSIYRPSLREEGSAPAIAPP